MVLSLSYNVWDGIELLPFLIPEIRKYVDIILINYQEVSYYGNKASNSDLELIYKLSKQGLIDRINVYKPKVIANSPMTAKILEKEKRNQGRNVCKELGATHHIDLDVDEGFKCIEFKNAKEYFTKNNIEYSAVKYINYFNKPIYQEIPEKESNNVIPFICKIEDNITLGSGSFLGNSDPTRSYMVDSSKIQYLFLRDKLIMHHFTGCRKNILNKFNNTSYVNLDRNKIPELINNIESISDSNLSLTNSSNFNMLSKQYKKVSNYFGIDI